MAKIALKLIFMSLKEGPFVYYAAVDFGNARVATQQWRPLKARLETLPSVRDVRVASAQGEVGVVVWPVDVTRAGKERFVNEVTSCARRHYMVTRVTHRTA